MNTKDKQVWYHCGHCGSLFQSDYGFDEDRLCEICNCKPGVGLWPVVNSIPSTASAKVASFNKKGDKVKKIARTIPTQKRKTRTAFWVAMVWMLVLLGLVGARFLFWDEEPKARKLDLLDLNKNLNPADRQKILNEVLPECERVIRGFFAATNTEERSQFIARSSDLRAAMETHEKDHAFPSLDAASLLCTGKEWIRLGDEWMVSTHWKDAEGKNEFDAVFRKEFEGWKLDWPHFSRYSEASWKSFLAGEGKYDQAEFRLLVKKHPDSTTPSLNEQRMMIILAAPEWGKPEQVVDESPAISIDLMSDEGQLLKATFELRDKNQAVGGGDLNPLDPVGFVRVRVHLTRDELVGEFRLTINELKACHWIDSDLSGF